MDSSNEADEEATHSNAIGNDPPAADEQSLTVSPYSNYSLEGRAGESSIGEDNASESGSSTQTGKQSLRRRAQEFDRLLQSQQRALTDYDSPERQETEDDGLQTELQELARSEVLLRKELEIFASSFRRPAHEEEEDEMDDSSTLPDYEDPALLRITSSGSKSFSPTKSSTPGMAPWTPPNSRATADGASQRVSLDSTNTDLPTLNEMRQQRLGRMSPTAQPIMPVRTPSEVSARQQDEDDGDKDDDDEEEEDEIVALGAGTGMQYPASLSSANQSSPTRRPLDAGVSSSPARVSLDDEVPSLLEPAFMPVYTSPLSTPSKSVLRPDTILESGQSSDDDSLFLDLAKLSSTTPRVSNIKGKAGQPLYDASPSSSQFSSLDQDSPRFLLSSGRNTQNPYATPPSQSDAFWAQSPSDQAGVTPVVPLPVRYDQSPLDAPAVSSPYAIAPSKSEESEIFVHTPAIPTPTHFEIQAQADRVDHIGLLDDFVGSSWKLPRNNQPDDLYATNTTPFLSHSDEDDQEVGSPPDGTEIVDTASLRWRRIPGSWSNWMEARRRRRYGDLLRVGSSADSFEPGQRERRNHRGLYFLALVLLCGIALIVIPTSIAASRNRRDDSSSSAVRGIDASLPPSPAPSTTMNPTMESSSQGGQPSLFETSEPSAAPTVSLTPSSMPSVAPSALPTVSPRPSASNGPSESPTRTSQPTTAVPSHSPTESPSLSPTRTPTNQPTDGPTLSPTLAPTAVPTTFQPSDGPTRSPTLALTTVPTMLPTLLPTLSPTTIPTLLPTRIPTIQPSFPPPTQIPTSLQGALTLAELLEPLSGQALFEAGTPQNAAYIWLSGDLNLESYTDERRIQRYAMATTYYSLDGDNWMRNDDWLSDESECDWFSRIDRGVCRPGGRRRLQRNPDDRVFTMRRLVLYYNNLSGSLPPEIGLLTDLEEIHLMGGPRRFISGSLPSELSSLTSLREVQLSKNSLTGAIPTSFHAWNELEFLDLSENSLQGALLDSHMSGWQSLKELNLSFNALTSVLPNIWPLSLRFLDMEQNNMSGPIPPSIGVLQDLRLLNLSYNQFTSLPSDIISLQSLEDLSLQSNQLEGALVSELGFLSRLRLLQLANNELVGTIPTQLGLLTRMVTALDLSYNNLTGSIPVELGNMNDRLRRLSLAGNQLTGIVPASLVDLDRLTEVRLEENDLTGSVPEALCTVWDRILPTTYIDCDEIDCPCCNFCCTDGVGCSCRFEGDPELEWRCH